MPTESWILLGFKPETTEVFRRFLLSSANVGPSLHDPRSFIQVIGFKPSRHSIHFKWTAPTCQLLAVIRDKFQLGRLVKEPFSDGTEKEKK